MYWQRRKKKTKTSPRRWGAAWGFAALMVAAPAAGETLTGEDIRLHDGSIGPASSTRLSNESGTLHIDQPTLAVLGAGHSTSASGVELHVGVAAVPEPSALWQLAAGALGLVGLARSRRRRKSIRSAASAPAIPALREEPT